MVKLLEEGLFKTLFDVQSFDLEAVRSLRENKNHIEISASYYANPFNKGCMVNMLDVAVLSALEIDLNFNVNVLTGSDGVIRGASGGHSDVAAGSKLTVIVAPSFRGRIPTIKDKVITAVTPGECVDVLVTERGIAINPRREDLIEKFKESKLPVKTIEELQHDVEKITGKPREIEFKDKIVGLVEYRDGTYIDVIREVAEQ
jgi:citrate lyase subunit alpha/citrate CoA-transferase